MLVVNTNAVVKNITHLFNKKWVFLSKTFVREKGWCFWEKFWLFRNPTNKPLASYFKDKKDKFDHMINLILRVSINFPLRECKIDFIFIYIITNRLKQVKNFVPKKQIWNFRLNGMNPLLSTPTRPKKTTNSLKSWHQAKRRKIKRRTRKKIKRDRVRRPTWTS